MKTLVSASTIRELKDQGEARIAAPPAATIVTPEARDLAARLGVVIDEEAAAPVVSAAAAPCPADKIKQAVSAQVPAGADPQMIEQLVRRIIGEMDASPAAGSCQRQVADNGVVLVRGNSVRMGRFDGAPGENIGLTDVITGADQSNISAGYMSWEDAFFPWKLNYDEIDVVLEGELHIRSGGTTYIGKPGDVFFIPNGASIEFGTPTSVRFVYVTYPADWSG